MTPRHERSLIRNTLAGCRVSAEELVRHHHPSLYAYMLRLTGRPETAEDVTQEAMVRALTHLERYDERFRFSTWLFTIAKRLYVNANQRLTPSFDSDRVELEASSIIGHQTVAAIGIERKAHIENALKVALDALSGEQREVVLLFYQLEWPVDSIAHYLDLPNGTIKSHLHRARAKMRSALESRSDLAAHILEALA